MSEWKDQLARRAVRVILIHPKSFIVGFASASVILGSLLSTLPTWTPIVGGPFTWIRVSERDALNKEKDRLEKKLSELEKQQELLTEKNNVLSMQLPNNSSHHQACDRISQEIDRKEKQIIKLIAERGDAVIRASPLSVDGSNAQSKDFGARSAEIDQDDAEIDVLKTALQSLRDQAKVNCIYGSA